jgi:hypothetical protein
MKVEILGGPMDGKIIEIPDETRTLDFPIVTDLTQIIDGAPGQPVFDKVTCEVNPLGFVIWPKTVEDLR